MTPPTLHVDGLPLLNLTVSDAVPPGSLFVLADQDVREWQRTGHIESFRHSLVMKPPAPIKAKPFQFKIQFPGLG